MNTREALPKTGPAPIVVGVDRTAAALAATRWAAEQARERGAPLVLLHAAPYLAAAPTERQPEQRARRILARAWSEAVRHAPGVTGHTELATDDPAAALVRVSAGAALVVLGLSGSGGIDEVLFGSATLGVPDRAGCPVVGVRTWPLPDTGQREIVVGVRDFATDAAAVETAFGEAGRRDRRLVALHCGPADQDPVEERRVLQEVDGWRRRYPDVRFHYEIERGPAADALLHLGGNAELIVVGPHTRGPLTRALLGSTSRALLRHSPVPVWVTGRTAVRPAGTAGSAHVGAAH